MRIYVASSWRNGVQPAVVDFLRDSGHEVYDFRNPRPGERGFAWSDIDPDWEKRSPSRFRAALEHPIARNGFARDMEAMQWADVCVLVLPCGRSAHTEAGWFAGCGKPVVVYTESACEPELMYRMFSGGIVLSLGQLNWRLDRISDPVEVCPSCGDMNSADKEHACGTPSSGGVAVTDGGTAP